MRLKIIVIVCIAVIFLTCSSAYANNQTDMCNFTQLNQIIDDSDDYVSLDKDYVGVNHTENLTISKAVAIRGNGHVIDCNSSSLIISEDNVTFENTTFRNFNMIFNNTNLTFIGCKFIFAESPNEIIRVNMVEHNNTMFPILLSTTGNISDTVRNLAIEIAGNSSDIEAAMKIAKWVGTNIKHETRAGFYQKPTDTLKRKKGNCCSQTDLFLQMCIAIGLNKNHKLYYVHTGTMEFGNRHFFAMIDNIFVDVDSRPKSPWSNALLKPGGIYRIIEYPYLPLERKY